MSVTKNIYSPSQIISPRYLRIEKDLTTAIIIIDDIVHLESTMHTEVDRQVAWLKITPGFELTVLDQMPQGVTAFDPPHGNWDKTRLFAQSSEVFVVAYDSTAKTQQSAVTGYAMGSISDAVYVKIDQQANTVTIYQ